jgi:glycosyltransferase involved in cell wall biosynthesis
MEWITDDVEGWTFRDGDSDDLAKQIVAAVNKKNELASLGKTARLKTKQMANWDKSVEKLLAAYHYVVDKDRFFRNTGGI